MWHARPTFFKTTDGFVRAGLWLKMCLCPPREDKAAAGQQWIHDCTAGVFLHVSTEQLRHSSGVRAPEEQAAALRTQVPSVTYAFVCPEWTKYKLKPKCNSPLLAAYFYHNDLLQPLSTSLHFRGKYCSLLVTPPAIWQLKRLWRLQNTNTKCEQINYDVVLYVTTGSRA